jgi:hypothetical protein
MAAHGSSVPYDCKAYQKTGYTLLKAVDKCTKTSIILNDLRLATSDLT